MAVKKGTNSGLPSGTLIEVGNNHHLDNPYTIVTGAR
jgi:hypothetical protein